jgi:hypothetical protein
MDFSEFTESNPVKSRYLLLRKPLVQQSQPASITVAAYSAAVRKPAS